MEGTKMSLDWSLVDVRDRSVNFPPDEDGLMNDHVHNVIWWSIPVGIDRITEENADLFWQRMTLWLGACEYDGPRPSRTQVHQLIGLSTNVGRRTDEDFARVLRETHERAERMRAREQVSA